jgi:predicted nucleic acid-binding protein
MHYLWRPFLKDVKDDMILETAFNGRANFIITYNLKHFKNVGKYFNIKPVTPSEILKITGGD